VKTSQAECRNERPESGRLRQGMDLRNFAQLSQLAAVDLFGMGFAITACRILFRDVVPPSVLNAWMAIASLALIGRIGVSLLFRNADRVMKAGQMRVGQWKAMFVAASLFVSLSWGALPFLIPGDAERHILLVATLFFALVSAGLVGAGISFPVFTAFAIPMLLPLSIRLFMAEAMFFYVMGAVSSVYLVAVLLIARRHTESAFREYCLSQENRELARRLMMEKQSAERANADKSRFLASASHDLRQPLHALDLYLAAMAGERNAERAADLLERARASSRALGELLNALLDVSRLDAESIRPQRDALRLLAPFEECVNEFEPVAREKGIELRMRHPRGACAWTDPMLFGRMLRNLVSNAVRHSTAGRVLIAARRRGDAWRVEVWDTGPGIADADLEDIFSEFYQIDNPERDREKGLGLGLGLAIVRRLSRLLDHPVAVCSRPGHGSCFSMLLPACDPATVAARASAGSGGADISGMFVLIVDDNVAIRDAMQGWLRLRACEALAAASGAEMLERLKGHAYPVPDAMIIDYRLRGDEPGLAVVKALRGHFGAEIPAVVISGDTARDVVSGVEAAGCRFLAKPVAQGVLAGILAGCARRRPPA